MLPTIHLGGTAVNVLARQAYDAMIQLDKAIGEFGFMGPNGRDYILQGMDAPSKASREFRELLSGLQAARDHAQAVYYHCLEHGATYIKRG